MSKALLGRKIGMSRYFLDDGTNIPVTIVEAGPCVVTQIKTEEHDGYNAVQFGYEDVKPSRATMPIIGHDAKAGTAPKRFHNECSVENIDDVELGQTFDVSLFEDVKFVDISGTSKGKGFQGGMKRHHFKGLEASHGVKRAHRRVGSINGHATNLGTGPKPKKGKRKGTSTFDLAGHRGGIPDIGEGGLTGQPGPTRRERWRIGKGRWEQATAPIGGGAAGWPNPAHIIDGHRVREWLQV